MKKILLAVAVLAATVTLTADLYAQGMTDGRGRHARYNRMYDPNTVETLSGEVTEVTTMAPGRAGRAGIHLLLQTDAETISVHLGPRWFIEDQDMQLEKGDRITVKGSRITFNDKPALIAAEIVKGEGILILRDEDGFPSWAGWRRGPRQW